MARHPAWPGRRLESHRPRMLVGDVTVWTGVRDDIDRRIAGRD
jgi:hypothetical protein